jgi:tetratricopeptide (TPR) repeat protein
MTAAPTRRAALVVLGALASASLGGCAALAASQTRALATRLPPGLPRRVDLDAVPFFPQTPLHCGPAALATVLVHGGVATTPEALADALYLPAREGSLAIEMVAAARRQGRVATRLPGELAVLLQALAAGEPMVILQNLGLAFAPRWHYAVPVGYDLEAGELLLRSGTERRQALALATFELTWARGDHWALAVTRAGQLPSGAEAPAALDAAVAFERTAPPREAARHYEAVLARWPELLAAGMGLGNTRVAAGDLAGAARAFEAAAARHDAAPAWNNLALVRWQLGERGAAREALERAERRVADAEPQWAAAVADTRARIGSP